MTHGAACLISNPLKNLIWQLPILPYEYPWILTSKKCIRGRKLPSIHEEWRQALLYHTIQFLFNTALLDKSPVENIVKWAVAKIYKLV